MLRNLWEQKALWVLLAAGNAALAGLVWIWLGLPEAAAWQLALSALMGLAIVAGALWLHGSTFAALRSAERGTPFVAVARRLPALLVWLALTAGLAAAAVRFIPRHGVWVAVAIAIALVPVLSAVAATGLRGLITGWRGLLRWEFYAAVLAAGLVGAYLPYLLIWWIPGVEGLWLQAASAFVRFLLAYLLVITGLLLLAAGAGRTSR